MAAPSHDRAIPLQFSSMEKLTESMGKMDLVALAKVAESAGRYRDVFEFACAYSYIDPVITVEQRTMLVASFEREIQRILRSVSKLDAWIAVLQVSAAPASPSAISERNSPDHAQAGSPLTEKKRTHSVDAFDSKYGSLYRRPIPRLIEYVCGARSGSTQLCSSSITDELSDRTDSTVQQQETVVEEQPAQRAADLASALRDSAVEELAQLCSTVIMLVTDFLLPAAGPAGKSHVLFLRKWTADVYRILWEHNSLYRFRELASTSAFGHVVPHAMAAHQRLPSISGMEPPSPQLSNAMLLPHHHLFQYPKINDAKDIADLYHSVLLESQVVLPPRSIVRAAILLNVCDFLVSRGYIVASHGSIKASAQAALDALDRYLCEVELECTTMNDTAKGGNKDERDFLFLLALLKRCGKALQNRVSDT